MTAAHTHDKIALAVIRYLGTGMLISLLGVIYLVHQATASANEIDPSTVALVAGVSTLAGTAFGALGSILASTGKGAPQPVQVVNDEADPVPVDPEPDPQAGHMEIQTAMLWVAIGTIAYVIGGIILRHI